ncbi:hypothetical protein BKA62DRAFT_699763 [Auriculariales sp. MPI-PUGE-AT-0066]|nr:hypothetical protein BKA62DRAFT_699763 [Auriculariales sp. MPI-PUGE-AT-0066]
MTRLANLAQATEEGNQLVQSAKEHLNTRRSTRAIIPSYAIFPASTSGLLAATPIPFPTTNVEECSPYSRTESRNGSRNNSLFSVAVTPASYDSRATSPLASPVSSSPDDKDKTSIASSAAPSSFRSSRSSSIANPLLAQVLNRRLNCKERSHSLAGSPTSSVTACPSQSMASFAPLDSADLQHKLLLTREKPRSTSQGRAQTYSAATGKKSGTLPSSGVATSTLRALATLDVNRPGAPRTRTWSKRLSSLWSITDDPADDLVNASAPTTPAIVHSRPAINRRHSRAATDLEEVQQSAPVRPGGVFDYGGPLPPLDPALAKQERNSKLLEARECASCGARGGSFPQCARGCGTAWCSRDCRMENRKVHNVACRALAGAGAKLAREKAATIA